MAKRRLFRKGAVLVGGVVLLTLGAIGVVLPILPGFVFILAGLVLLASEYTWADRVLLRARNWVAEKRQAGERSRQTSDTR